MTRTTLRTLLVLCLMTCACVVFNVVWWRWVIGTMILWLATDVNRR